MVAARQCKFQGDTRWDDRCAASLIDLAMKNLSAYLQLGSRFIIQVSLPTIQIPFKVCKWMSFNFLRNGRLLSLTERYLNVHVVLAESVSFRDRIYSVREWPCKVFFVGTSMSKTFQETCSI